MRTFAFILTAFLCSTPCLNAGPSATISSNAQNEIHKEKKAAASDTAVIGYLEKRGYMITILAGSRGPRYTIEKKDGTVVAEKINAAQLRAKHPEIFRDLKTGIAGNDARLHRDGGRPAVIFSGE